MLMSNFLRDRRSVREFRDKKANNKMLSQIQESISEVQKEVDNNSIEMTLYTDGTKIYEGLQGAGGYSGVMIKSPHYIGLEIKDDKDETQIYAAYYFEKLITEVNKAGLEACWVTLKEINRDKKADVFGDHGSQTDYVLSIGYPPRKNPFAPEKAPSARIGVEEIVFDGEVEKSINMDELESRALDDLFYYVRFAPSTRNSQPWRFLLEKNSVKLLLSYDEQGEVSLVDAGVIMYYFEKMANSMGVSSKWSLIDGEVKGEKLKYRYIAEFKL